MPLRTAPEARSLRSALLLLTTVLATLGPFAARADRGALTLEIGPALTWWPSLQPPVGSGPGLGGSAAGGVVGVRYALSNRVELTGTGFYEVSASYTFPGVSLTTGGETLDGTLQGTMSRWGVLAGARYVIGLVWRLHLGVEVGWSQESSTKLDLLNVSTPASPQSFGLGLTDVARNAFVIAPLAGVEWQLGDRWSLALIPRVEIGISAVTQVAVVVPLTVGYSLYVF
jgi:hypothetical protein